MQCVRDVFPDAEVNANCVDKYPIKVMVEAKVGSSKVKVWEGDQRNLFRKYASERAKSQQAIKENLEMLKEEHQIY